MAIIELSRAQLNQEFRDGERPSGDDFASAWLSFLNKTDDGLKIDTNGNLELNRGITVKDTAAGQAGTLRFNGGQLQYHDGTAFNSVSTGSSGAFLPVAGGPSVAFGGGNVGIGNFVAAPTHRLEIILGDNTAADQRVKIGNLAIHNGPVATPGAYICHSNQGGNPNSFALSQDSQGGTRLNSALNTELLVQQNAALRIRINVGGGIELLPATSVSVGSAFDPKNLTVFGDVTVGSLNNIPPRNFTVHGQAFKTGGGAFASIASDLRVKKAVRPFNEGLAKVVALQPISFRFNGKADTPDDGMDYIGLVAQDLQKVLPELIISRSLKLDQKDQEETEILTYDQGPLLFVIINAIKELAANLDKLKKSISNEKRKSKDSTGIEHR